MEDRERQLIQKAKMLTSKLRAEQDEVVPSLYFTIYICTMSSASFMVESLLLF